MKEAPQPLNAEQFQRMMSTTTPPACDIAYAQCTHPISREQFRKIMKVKTARGCSIKYLHRLKQLGLFFEGNFPGSGHSNYTTEDGTFLIEINPLVQEKTVRGRKKFTTYYRPTDAMMMGKDVSHMNRRSDGTI